MDSADTLRGTDSPGDRTPRGHEFARADGSLVNVRRLSLFLLFPRESKRAV